MRNNVRKAAGSMMRAVHAVSVSWVGAVLGALAFPAPAFANMGYFGPGSFTEGGMDAGFGLIFGCYAVLALLVSGLSIFALRRLASKLATQVTETSGDD